MALAVVCIAVSLVRVAAVRRRAAACEVDSICGSACSRYVRDISETVCEEVSRLWSGARPAPGAAAFRARLETTLLSLACQHHLTRKAENYVAETLASIPPLDAEETKRMNKIIEDFKKRMELQLASLHCDVQSV